MQGVRRQCGWCTSILWSVLQYQLSHRMSHHVILSLTTTSRIHGLLVCLIVKCSADEFVSLQYFSTVAKHNEKRVMCSYALHYHYGHTLGWPFQLTGDLCTSLEHRQCWFLYWMYMIQVGSSIIDVLSKWSSLLWNSCLFPLNGKPSTLWGFCVSL